MGYNLFISHKACSLVLDVKVFVCTNFVITVVKTATLKVSGQGDIIVITL